ncbi:MAG: FHA domain-containing protein [Pyrinomonadaceae bacterium]
MSVLDKVRRWIDGDSAELVLENAARDAQIKPRSQAEEFIVKLARSVEEVMQREMVPLPQGTTLIPTEYIIFLSEQDDKEWQGVKRRGLEQGLYHVLSERAREISGKKKLGTQSFSVELRVDGTLEKGEIRVQHGWDEGEREKTGVLARPKAQQPSQIKDASAVTQISNQPNVQNQSSNPIIPTTNYTQQPPTVAQTDIQQYVPPISGDGEEKTQVRRRAPTELYRLEIWRGGVRQSVIPVYQNQISIGRGSRSKPVDIPLPDDPEISRRHITLMCDAGGNFWMINEGRNPATIAGREIPQGQRAAVRAGEPIAVCSYLLRIQPK